MSLGAFSGLPTGAFLPDGRRFQLTVPFSYTDPANVVWGAPNGAIVDGASIPRLLWTLMGGPFEGKYRNASIIHDWYCDRRTKPWEAVHKVFFDGMITAGVPQYLAKTLYGGVLLGGPRWTDTVVANNNLDSPAPLGVGLDRGGVMEKKFGAPRRASRHVETNVYKYNLTKKDLEKLEAESRSGGKDLDHVHAMVDGLVARRKPVVVKKIVKQL